MVRDSRKTGILIALGALCLGAAVWLLWPHSWSGPAPGRWVTIRSATFERGSPEGEAGHRLDEEQHRVTLTGDFLIQEAETSEAQYFEVLGQSTYHRSRSWGRPHASRWRPSGGGRCGARCPARFVSWHDAAVYCNALSAGEGLPPCYRCSGESYETTCRLDPELETPYACSGYRLPTEAEWEHAARAGTVTSTYNGDLDHSQLSKTSYNPVLNPIAWIASNSDYGTHPRGEKQPNAFGLLDMLGNVSEWCHDWYGRYTREAVTDPWGPAAGEAKVVRGGSAGQAASKARAAARDKGPPGDRSEPRGFRPVRSLP